MKNKLNRNDAPPGYYAVLKSEAKSRDGSNICCVCDWRPDCSSEKYPCMAFTIITPDGRTLKREDGHSVLFKRRHGHQLGVINPEK